MQQRGILQPLRVRPGDQPDTYIVVAGHRRLLAYDAAGLDAPIDVVIEHQTDSHEIKVNAIIENVQRLDLNPVDEAAAYASLKQAGWSVKGIAEQTGVAQKRVTERLRLLELPPDVVALIAEGKVPLSCRKSLEELAKVSEHLASRAALRASKDEAKAGILAKHPQMTVAALADEAKEPFWRVGGDWTADRVRSLGKHDGVDDLADNLDGLEAEFGGHNARLFVDQDGVDQLVAGGTAYVVETTANGQQRAVATDVPALMAVLTALYDAHAGDIAERHVGDDAEPSASVDTDDQAPTSAPADDTIAQAAAEAAEKERRRIAAEGERRTQREVRGRNLQLGRALIAQLHQLGQSASAIRLVVITALANMDTGLQFQAGLRMVLEQFQSETDKGHVTYSGATKAEARELATEWVLGADDATQLLGRFAALMVAAEYADKRAVPQSKQAQGKVVFSTVDDLECLAGLLPEAAGQSIAARDALVDDDNEGLLAARVNLSGGYSIPGDTDWQGNPYDAYGRSAAAPAGEDEQPPADENAQEGESE